MWQAGKQRSVIATCLLLGIDCESHKHNDVVEPRVQVSQGVLHALLKTHRDRATKSLVRFAENNAENGNTRGYSSGTNLVVMGRSVVFLGLHSVRVTVGGGGESWTSPAAARVIRRGLGWRLCWCAGERSC